MSILNDRKTIKPFLNNKTLNPNELMLIEKKNLISKERVLVNLMNKYLLISQNS